MNQPRCLICDRTDWLKFDLPHGWLCWGCARNRHYHPRTCPGCRRRRPLVWLDDELLICAACAGVDPSPFACAQCGSEEHPYGGHRCARCILTERLGTLLTDPTTGLVHHQLQPVFDELVTRSEKPQTGIWWLGKKEGRGDGPRLLGQMARGEVAISHDTFRTLPSDRAHDYLRTLLAALGVLPAFNIHLERMNPWLDVLLADDHGDDAALVRRFAHWHVIRGMRRADREDRLSQAVVNGARQRIRVASEFLTHLRSIDIDIAAARQGDLEDYEQHRGRSANAEYAFIGWLRDSRINTAMRVPYRPPPGPGVTVSDHDRWAAVDRLLHDTTLLHYTRIGGLFTLLFAQPLGRIVAMRTSQITNTDTGLFITFNTLPIQMPPVLDDLIHDHLTQRGKSLYVSRDTGWLFPGGNPGRHLATENIRTHLVAIGIKPYENRKAALFQLAAEVPAPVLADLIDISNDNAYDWARLAAHDWSSYIAQRAK